MTESFRYSRLQIALHWLTALTILAGWATAQIIDAVPRDLKGTMQGFHADIGLAVGLIVLIRLVSRAWFPAAPDAPGGAWVNRAAHAVHLLLYALVAAAVLGGLLTAWARGMAIPGLPAFPPAPDLIRGARRAIKEVHELAANAILITAGLHAAAALAHHYLLGDNVLRRMLPQRG